MTPCTTSLNVGLLKIFGDLLNNISKNNLLKTNLNKDNYDIVQPF